MNKNTLFIDVDTQRDFMENTGALPIPGAKEIIPSLKKLTELAVERGIPILATVDTHTSDDPEFTRFPPHCIEGTSGWEKIEATGGVDSERFEKTTFDIFTNSSFAERVKELNPRSVVVYGVATDYCIKDAVLGLLKIVPRVFLVEDAIRAVNEEEGQKALQEMQAAGAMITTLNRIAGMFEEDGC